MFQNNMTGATPQEFATIPKVRRKLLPLLLVLYVAAFIDRINLGFAALTMNRELALTSQQFGLAAGIFFWGYFLVEIPSNLILHRVGARTWIARILVTWGVIATATGFVQSASQLYVARFALGLAEAGFFPGVVLYLGYWFPQREKAKAIALVLVGMPLASILGAPVSGFILDHAHWLGLSGWRWLLILEGAPAVALGFLTYWLLPSRPAEARFLTPDERQWVTAVVAREDQEKSATRTITPMRVLGNARVWQIAAIGFGHGFATYAFSFWMPQVMKSVLSDYSNTAIGILVAVPSVIGLAAMVVVARHSDNAMERRWHMVLTLALAGFALLLLGIPHSTLLTLALFSCVTVGAYGFLPVFFTTPGEFLTGFSAAAGIALVTSIANLGGFVGPLTLGIVRQHTGSLLPGLACAGCFYLLSAILALSLRDRADST
jgi:ACS family tartrate transporter-like MFS transporter